MEIPACSMKIGQRSKASQQLQDTEGKGFVEYFVKGTNEII